MSTNQTVDMDFHPEEWLHKNLTTVKNFADFAKYFDSLPIEEGIEVFCILNADLGIDVILDQGFFVKSVHLYSEKLVKDVSGFNDTLPFGLAWDYSQEKARTVLGEPVRCGGGGFSILYGTVPMWDKVLFPNFFLHIQYKTEGESIDLITIDSLSTLDQNS